MYRINASLIKTERDFIFAILGVVFTEAKKKLGEDREKVLKPLNRITKKYLYVLSPPENGLYDSIEELTAAESYHTVESDFINLLRDIDSEIMITMYGGLAIDCSVLPRDIGEWIKIKYE